MLRCSGITRFIGTVACEYYKLHVGPPFQIFNRWLVNSCYTSKTTLASYSQCSREAILVSRTSRSVHDLLSRSYNNAIVRSQHSQSARRRKETGSIVMYIIAAGVFMTGAAYAGVPLYRMFCQSTGIGGEVQKGHDSTKVENMNPVKERTLKIRFNADIASSMQWNFRPHQSEIKVVPGETALAFYKARNPSDVPVIGISTYNVVPFEAAPYFHKIQCFCFEEQRLNPREEVDLPVFFYIDPEFCDDPKLEHIDIITLSYTFFEAKEGMTLPTFNYTKQGHL